MCYRGAIGEVAEDGKIGDNLNLLLWVGAAEYSRQVPLFPYRLRSALSPTESDLVDETRLGDHNRKEITEIMISVPAVDYLAHYLRETRYFEERVEEQQLKVGYKTKNVFFFDVQKESNFSFLQDFS